MGSDGMEGAATKAFENFAKTGADDNREVKEQIGKAMTAAKEQGRETVIDEVKKAAAGGKDTPDTEKDTPDTGKDKPGVERFPTPVTAETRGKVDDLMEGKTDTITLSKKELSALMEQMARESAKKALEELSLTEKFKEEIESMVENKVNDINKTGMKWRDTVGEKAQSFVEKGREFGKKALEIGKNLAGKGKDFLTKWLDRQKDKGISLAYHTTGLAQKIFNKIAELSGKAGEGLGNIREDLGSKRKTPEKAEPQPQAGEAVKAGAEKAVEKVKQEATEKAAEAVLNTAAPGAGTAAKTVSEVAGKIVPKVAGEIVPKIDITKLKGMTTPGTESMDKIAGKAIEAAAPEKGQDKGSDSRSDR